MLSFAEERDAKNNLERAFQEVKWRHTSVYSSRTELDYCSFTSSTPTSRLLDKYQSEVDDLVRFIENEERSCDDYLLRHCPAFYKATANSRVASWQELDALEDDPAAMARILEAIADIDDYAAHRSMEVMQDFQAGIHERYCDIARHGAGTAFRQRLTSAMGLKREVNDLVGLGLHSVGNSSHVYLGDHFVQLLKDDPAMEKVIAEVEKTICYDIRKYAYRIPYLSAQKMDNRHSGRTNSYGWGGKCHSDPMFTQLTESILNPISSAFKYADTWKVGMNELTWSLRHASVAYTGNYHAVHNVYGFAFLWEMEFSIEDILDLRPHSGKSIDFGGKDEGERAYNIVTSILGTAYHDILGNTDNLRVRASWTENGDCDGQIHSW